MGRKINGEQEKRSKKSATTQSSWVELYDHLGVSVKQSRSGQKSSQRFPSKLRSVELFAGAGGMSLGLLNAGFEHEAIVELNKEACETIRKNHGRTCANFDAPVFQADVTTFKYDLIKPNIDLLAGGPPCQPFSQGGKHKGMRDQRNMFPEMFRATLALSPKAIIIENVKGLSRASFSQYFTYILEQLAYPEIIRKKAERWQDHLRRLCQHRKSKSRSGLSYDVNYKVVNAADYGVPQRRERVFIVCFRSDLDLNWSFPRPTHSRESLLWDQSISGTYWDRHKISRRPLPQSKHWGEIERLVDQGYPPILKPWKTVRDAFVGLPEPYRLREKGVFLNHSFNTGARAYPGHTGSLFDEPSKTIKAGSHGVPGGENMLCYPNGRLRYFSVRECARLQSFPDYYEFSDTWSSSMKQIGNAVPVCLAQLFGQSVKDALAKNIFENLSSRQFKSKRDELILF